MKVLSPRQKQVLELIKKSIETSCRPPSYRELARALSVSPEFVSRVIDALVKKDEVAVDVFTCRAVRLNSDRYKVEVKRK